MATADGPSLIKTVYDALAQAAEPLVTEALRAEPAVSIRSSIKANYLVFFKSGAKPSTPQA